ARNEFLAYLRRMYGTEIRAWRHGLDPKDTFVLSMESLRHFCGNELEMRADQQALWKSLDRAAEQLHDTSHGLCWPCSCRFPSLAA
ncbi:unnamed protein product, partial [Polarella glacialis]